MIENGEIWFEDIQIGKCTKSSSHLKTVELYCNPLLLHITSTNLEPKSR